MQCYYNQYLVLQWLLLLLLFEHYEQELLFHQTKVYLYDYCTIFEDYDISSDCTTHNHNIIRDIYIVSQHTHSSWSAWLD